MPRHPVRALFVGSLASLFLSTCAHGDTFADQSVQNRLDPLALDFQELSKTGFSGSILVACDGEILFKNDYGVFPEEGQTVRYEVASITKWITAITVLKLVDDRVVSLDDHLTRFWPDAPSDKADITVSQLLLHQSGIDQNYAAEGQFTLDAASNAIFEQPLIDLANDRFSYSNDNYSLLAMIIELVTEQGYQAYMTETVMTPLGLEPIAFWPDDIRASEHFPPLLNPRDSEGRQKDWGFRGGHGARLSVEELHQIYLGVVNGKILSPGSVKLLFSPQHNRPSGTGIAFGWYTNVDEEGRHLGSTRGHDDSGGNAVLYRVDNDGLIVIAATNHGPAREHGPGWSRDARDLMLSHLASGENQIDICHRTSGAFD
ncbi:hypothetical protein GCM10009096_01730 [Parasphingorhabdus litoris]|uniref:Beta-lactamase-related domain-containing protein n=1 Tax=Parasphingorhabdus litoris TaxID=394733 RepID=A0ABP3JUX6_9SPHN|nr:serine hydrolase [Parasphingorhabdus litoris]